MNEEVVLKWLVDQISNDEIEDVSDKMLEQLIDKSKHLAVLFCMSVVISYLFDVFPSKY